MLKNTKEKLDAATRKFLFYGNKLIGIYEQCHFCEYRAAELQYVAVDADADDEGNAQAIMATVPLCEDHVWQHDNSEGFWEPQM